MDWAGLGWVFRWGPAFCVYGRGASCTPTRCAAQRCVGATTRSRIKFIKSEAAASYLGSPFVCAAAKLSRSLSLLLFLSLSLSLCLLIQLNLGLHRQSVKLQNEKKETRKSVRKRSKWSRQGARGRVAHKYRKYMTLLMNFKIIEA